MGCKCNFITKATLEVQSECENLIAWGKKKQIITTLIRLQLKSCRTAFRELLPAYFHPVYYLCLQVRLYP